MPCDESCGALNRARIGQRGSPEFPHFETRTLHGAHVVLSALFGPESAAVTTDRLLLIQGLQSTSGSFPLIQ